MHVGIIRGDMPGAVLLDGLEPVSQHHASVDPRGQEVYVGRPTAAEIEAILADDTVGAGATINGIGDLSGLFPVTITNGVSDILRLRTAAGDAFTAVDIAAAAYANITDLIAAVNAALQAFGMGITAFRSVSPGGADERITFESDTKGVDSFIELDTVGNGSTANAPLLTPDGIIRTMVPAVDLITDCLPVGGPLDVSAATISASGVAATALLSLLYIPAARGTHSALANAIAPLIFNTVVAQDSYLGGQIADLLNAGYTPDPNLLPTGAAVEVVEDDGSTTFATANALPVLTSATLDSPGAGDVTIAGTNLAGPGDPTSERKDTVVKFIGDGTPAGGDLVLSQELIEANGGTVTMTSIVIPAVLNSLTGFATTTTSAQVQYRSFVTAVVALV